MKSGLNQYRVGNIVLSDGTPVEIEGIDVDHGILTTANNRGSCNGVISPIRLTLEIIKEYTQNEYAGKFGFCITCEDGLYPNSDLYILFDEEKNECYIDVELEYIIKRGIKFLHELQNVYYTFENEQLTKIAKQ